MKPSLLFCVLLVAGLAKAASKPTSPPDILLIMPDQMRGDCLSAHGHPVVRTPNLDKLAGEGALFRRAYTTCPSCIPARHPLLTGLFPATSGVVGFAGRPITSPTLPKLIGDAGYTTLLVGRTMHQVPEEEPYGFQKRIRGSTYVAWRATMVQQLAGRPEGFSVSGKLVAGRPCPPLQGGRAKRK
jgi:arylsulfatase A-like enzyme